jgi:hypothetical protein
MPRAMSYLETDVLILQRKSEPRSVDVAMVFTTPRVGVRDGREPD